MPNPTFIIADNQAISRAGLHRYITALFPSPTVVDATEKQSLIRRLAECGEGIVVIDYALFDLKSFDEYIVLQKRFPDSRWIWFSEELSEAMLLRINAEERSSILLKSCSEQEIETALRHAAGDRKYVCSPIKNFIDSRRKESKEKQLLTPTEIEVLKLIAAGKSVKEIANARNSSAHTITTHKKNIFRKIGANNVYEATKYALRAGLVEMMEYYI